jgi:hypothetical protein
MEMNHLELERLIITSSLLYGAYTTFYCPCGNKTTGEGLLSCHLPQILSSVGLPLIMILYINRNNIMKTR